MRAILDDPTAPHGLRHDAAPDSLPLAHDMVDTCRRGLRALVELEAAGRVRSIGRTRAQRWLAPPLAGFTTNLLLPAALPLG